MILNDIKTLLGIDETNEDFDNELIIQINSVFALMTDFGYPPFQIDTTTEWSGYVDSLEGDPLYYAIIKTYIYLKTRIVFDPPQTGPMMEALERVIKEYEWRVQLLIERSDIGG